LEDTAIRLPERLVRTSDRIRLIKEVCAKLRDLDWSELDLILRQFGLPWSMTWDGDKEEYCLHHVEQGEDSALAGLYEHLSNGKQFEAAPRVAGDHLWQEGYFRLFLSHVSAHKQLVSEVKSHLIVQGVDAFVAHEDIAPTKEWEPEIEAALETCDALAAFLTPDFHNSLWTDQEVGFCVRRRILIVPIRMGRDPYGLLGRYQALNAVARDAAWIADALFNILIDHDLTSERLSPAVVKLFEESGSFAQAKRNLGYVKRIRRWSPSLLRRLEETIDSNGQVEGAWGVPDQVRSLVKEHSRSGGP
jgi:hypothetical protein